MPGGVRWQCVERLNITVLIRGYRMSARSLFNERFGMLMACASPGSALAYHLGTDATEPELVQRGTADQTTGSGPRSGTNWLQRAFDRLEQWSWDREMKAQEAYLSQA